MRNTSKLSPSLINTIVDEYVNDKSATCASMSRKFLIDAKRISRELKARNITIRPLSHIKRKDWFNTAYFKEIDTENKAYFLGLLYADGCNSKDISRVSIALKSSDNEILYSFLEDIESTQTVCKYINKTNTKSQAEMSSIRFKSGELCEDLEKLGCGQRKSLTLDFPTPNQVPRNLFSHFLRGYLDGDGSIITGYVNKKFKTKSGEIHTTKSFNPQVVFCVSEQFGNKLLTYLSSELNTSGSMYARKNNKIHVLQFGGNHQIKKLLDYIYTDVTKSTKLQRKYNKYIEFLNIFSTVNKRK